jgi:16S rRNA (cytosine1402-N4)-methyltransferase
MTHNVPLAPDPASATHVPVLVEEVLTGLDIQPGVRVLDGTLGGAGHTTAILARSAPAGKVLGIDADPAAIHRVQTKLADAIANGRLLIVQGNFGDIEQIANTHHFTAIDAILLDLGVSSFQLETGPRGFSFVQDGSLDMRFDPTQGVSAAEIINTWREDELADLIYRYGEERQSRRIARHLVQQRPFASTGQLAAAVEKAVGGRRGSRIHPATQTFQALRMAVNQELDQLARALPQCLRLLSPGGRLAVISFHSLEDRIVKQWMQQEASAHIPDPASFSGRRARVPTMELITRKPITATAAEIERNPRSRSAKLRMAKKVMCDT